MIFLSRHPHPRATLAVALVEVLRLVNYILFYHRCTPNLRIGEDVELMCLNENYPLGQSILRV